MPARAIIRTATAIAALTLLAPLAQAQNARRGPAVYNTDPYSGGGQGRSINSPGSVQIDNSHQVPSCNTTREQVPTAGGGLVWQLRTDCTRDPY